MGCGCRKQAPAATRTAAADSPKLTYEVYKGDRSTGRKFTSLPAAQSYARSINGEVRSI